MEEKLETNLKVLKRTRKKPQPGDIFVFQLESFSDRYFFGRVIKTDTKIGNCSDVILIYIYKTTSTDKLQIPKLRIDDLMFPPEGINTLPWTRGYFETVRSDEISPSDVYARHCFKSCSKPGLYFDEYGNRLEQPFEPCGEWGMAGYGTIERHVSQYMAISTGQAIPSP
jgi:Immunity protein 26